STFLANDGADKRGPPQHKECDYTKRKGKIHDIVHVVIVANAFGNSFHYLAPTGIGLKCGHRSCYFRRILAQVFLQQHTILIDDECHDSRVTILRWIGYEGETTNHFSIDHIVSAAAGCVIALL